MIVLDDIFSGLDGANINSICERLLDRHTGYLRSRGITVILSTHNGLFLYSTAFDLLTRLTLLYSQSSGLCR